MVEKIDARHDLSVGMYHSGLPYPFYYHNQRDDDSDA